MNLQIRGYNFVVNLEEKINVIKIENIKEYRRIVECLVLHFDTKEGDILISDGLKLLIPSKSICVFDNYYNFDINKYCLNKMLKILTDVSQTEYFSESIKVKNEVENYVYKIIENYDMYFDINSELDIVDIFKSMGIRIKTFEGNILDRIFNYINVISESIGITTFFFINLSSNLTDDERIDFYKFIEYNDVKAVLFENTNFEKSYENENIITIDQDLCEIY